MELWKFWRRGFYILSGNHFVERWAAPSPPKFTATFGNLEGEEGGSVNKILI